MGKIIAISGTHGTGKSTTAYKVCSKLRLAGKNAVVLDELARKCPFPINKEANAQTPVWLTFKQLLEELELQSFFDYVVADRSVLDAYCYNLVIHGGAVDLKPALSMLCDHINTYYHRIYVPDMEVFNYHVADGFRDMDPVFRADVHHTLLDVYNSLDVDYTLITSIDQIHKDLDLV